MSLCSMISPFPSARLASAREGSDVTIVVFGIGMSYAMEAAEKLSESGLSAEVIDLRSLRPMDTQTVIESVKKTNRCVTVEEGFPVGAIGNHISAFLCKKRSITSMRRSSIAQARTCPCPMLPTSKSSR